MGSITTGIGLISGIDTATLIEQLIGLQAQQKVPIFSRIGQFTASKTALMDVNARLLNLQSASKAFRLENIFRSAVASSNNESVLTAIAGTNAIPGTYNFTVKQLVSSSQLMSRGFASSSLEPMNLDELRFEWGQGNIARDVSLDAINGGRGVDRGSIRVTDRSGNETVIDLSLATTINEVLDTINNSSDVSVRMEISSNRLVVRDLSGGSGTISIQNADGSTTATDLGVAGSGAGDALTGTPILLLGLPSLLTDLNDGLGVFIRDNVTDFRLRVGGVGGTTYDIDLGRMDALLTGESLLADLNDGEGIAINGDGNQADFTITTTTGVTVNVDLGVVLDDDGEVLEEAVSTVQELFDRVNGTLDDAVGAGTVVMAFRSDGRGFEMTDTLGGGGVLETAGAGPNGEETARDLGIFTGAGAGSGSMITGSAIPNTVQQGRATTIQDLLDRITEQTDGVVIASLNGTNDGIGLHAGGQFLAVLDGDIDGSSYAADIASQTLVDLGLTPGDENLLLDGDRVLGGMGSTLIDSINGGNGLNGASSITVSDRNGDTTTVTGLDSFATVADLVTSLNASLLSAGVNVIFDLNAERSGLIAEDHTVGSDPLVVSGDVAVALGIADSVNGEYIRGTSLQRKYVGFATNLSELNYGRGVGTGEFRLTDSSGRSATIDIGADSTTVYDVIAEINSRGLAVEARINANGDGLLLVDTNTETPQVPMKVETVSGSTARDLGLLGVAADVGSDLDGTYERVVDLELTDTLEEVIGKVNDAGLNVVASLLDTGTGGTPYRMVLSSSISGRDGDLIIDTGRTDLGTSELTRARNAKIFIGEGTDAVLVESTSNTLDDVLAGITLNLHAASNETVSISVSRDETTIVEAVNRFVTTFNDVIGRLNDYDAYDAENEVRGPLLGDPTVARIRSDMHHSLQQRAVGIETQYHYLSEVGIRIASDGLVEFDEEKFATAYDNDPEAVENLFAAMESQGSTTETIAPGVTIDNIEFTHTVLGFGEIFDLMVEGLSNSVDGTITYADQRFQSLIDSANERIERIDERLEAKRERLQQQFIAMEMALAQLQSQQGALNLLAMSASQG
jgi:flagellar hook-associated protein 2